MFSFQSNWWANQNPIQFFSMIREKIQISKSLNIFNEDFFYNLFE